jgi:hypothetical protein
VHVGGQQQCVALSGLAFEAEVRVSEDYVESFKKLRMHYRLFADGKVVGHRQSLGAGRSVPSADLSNGSAHVWQELLASHSLLHSSGCRREAARLRTGRLVASIKGFLVDGVVRSSPWGQCLAWPLRRLDVRHFCHAVLQ